MQLRKHGINRIENLIAFHIRAAFIWLGIAMLAGLLLATRLMSPHSAEIFGDIPWLQFGRVRMAHTHFAVFGWLTNGFYAGAYWMAPRLTQSSLFLPSLARINRYWAQFALLLGGIGILLGHAEGVEYAEAPWWADIPFALSFVGVLVCIVGTCLQTQLHSLYVSLWYLLLGFVFTALNFVMANTLVAHIAPGAAGAALSGLWIHNAVGLWVTPMGIALVYYLLPAIVKKPIWSHSLSLLGFWTLAILYPLGGGHHYFYSPLPGWLQVLAVPLTAALLFVVYSVVANFFATMKGSWHLLASHMALRFLTFGIFAYLFTCTQGPFQSLLSVQKVVHFTDWVVAHAHLALFSVFSFWLFAFFYYWWPQYQGKPYRENLAEWHFWLSVLGFFLLYYVPDTIAGLMQGFFWLRGLPFIDSVTAAQPFWIPRALSGVFLLTGVVCMALSLRLWERPTLVKDITST